MRHLMILVDPRQLRVVAAVAELVGIRPASAYPDRVPNPAQPFYHAAMAASPPSSSKPSGPYYSGSERGAQWEFFAGHLDAADRLDLVIRDAAVRQPAAFAPRDIFRMLDLPDDEPLGPRWVSPFLAPDACHLLRTVEWSPSP
jgi:hypothetical protein